jgi:hypothetical protein
MTTITFRSRGALLAVLAAAGLSFVGCYGLEVTNPNGHDITSVFQNASNTEAALVGGWRAYWQLNNSECPTLALSIWSNELTATNAAYLQYSTEPRLPIENRDNVNCTTRNSYWVPFQASSAGREGYNAIINNQLKFGTVNATYPDGQGTPARLILAKFLIAISQLKLGLDFDQAYIVDHTTIPAQNPYPELKPWPEVLANAVQQLRGVIADARAAENFTWPTTWVNGRAITRDELIRICMAYIIYADVYSARNPAARAAVNWGLVLARLDSAITRDFAQQAAPDLGPTNSTYINNSFAQNTVRISYRLIGPADTSGGYQNWLRAGIANRTAFTIATPDRRIHGAAGPTAIGTRFTRLSTTMQSIANGAYLGSSYRSNRYLNASADSGNRALVPIISMDEMKYLRAEALYRLGRNAEAAALINPTRIAANLRPVDANGPPAGRDCVPRKDDGTCGDLFDAIQYEKRIDLYPYRGDIGWYDARGWGKLMPGTPFHLPVSGRELITRGLPYYTFGGVGQPGSAP